MRIAVINRKYCKPEECGFLCMKVCPINKTKKKCIEYDGQIIINEELCIGCGICVKKCPYNAISIINLPDEFGEPIFQYGKNGFRLYNLPIIEDGKVVGIIGKNGIGKSTAMKILAGILKIQNFEKIKGTELQKYFEKEHKISYKPQEVDKIPEIIKGKVKDFLSKYPNWEEITEELELYHILDRDISVLSGGELQRLAIAVAFLKESEILFIDEPSNYLDIYQRFKFIQFFEKHKKTTLLIEHDLVLLDYLSDYIHIAYGKEGVFGWFSKKKGVSNGINEFLLGYLKEENIRIRDDKIVFDYSKSEKKFNNIKFEYQDFKVKKGDFELNAFGDKLYETQIVGILGKNGIGKTTFVEYIYENYKDKYKISYKRQYIKYSEDMKVKEYLDRTSEYYNVLKHQLNIEVLENKYLSELSGGEKQRVEICKTLLEEADLYIFDEPSAMLDVEYRLYISSLIKRTVENRNACAFVIEHDILFLDSVSDSLIVFEGEPGIKGVANKIENPISGMNRFLKDVGITFRRDEITKRPRINKIGSQKDVQQKKEGKYYY
jgi:ATP-binding cassette subfamily E protein 1